MRSLTRNVILQHRSAMMHTCRVSSPRHSASRVFFCLETASLYSSPTRLHSPTPPTHFPLCHRFLRHPTPLASTREGAALPDDPRLASCSTRPLVCITAGARHRSVLSSRHGRPESPHLTIHLSCQAGHEVDIPPGGCAMLTLSTA
jgi:hypothetical protein